MIVVRVEVHNANTGECEDIGEMRIYNVDTHHEPGEIGLGHGSYEYDAHVHTIQGTEHEWRGKFDGHNRELHVWHLVRRALEKLP